MPGRYHYDCSGSKGPPHAAPPGEQTQNRTREVREVRFCVCSAADFSQQQNWVLRGDDRGIYGLEGAELMHYLHPARDQVKRLNRRR